MSAAETVRQALPDEYCLEFWSNGLRSDGRGLHEARPLSVEVLSKSSFSVTIGDNICAGSYLLGAQRSGPSAECLKVVVEQTRRGERSSAAAETVTAALLKTFKAVLEAVGERSIEIRVKTLLEDGNCIAALFCCCQLCLVAALSAIKLPSLSVPLADARLFCVAEVAEREFVLVDPTADELAARCSSTAEILALIDESQAISLATLRAGRMRLASLRQVQALALSHPAQFSIFKAALSSAAEMA